MPVEALMAEPIHRRADALGRSPVLINDGQEAVTVDTGRPDGIEAADGETRFRVSASHLVL